MAFKVLSITGCGRSGSTILTNILGELEGFFALGESRFLWDRSLQENRLCGCGQPFRGCELWGRVINEGIDRLDDQQLSDIVSFRDSLSPARALVRSLAAHSFFTRRPDSSLNRYAEQMKHLYQAIHRVTGSRVLVDSSKPPSHAYVLNQIPDLEHYVVLVVRDPRAVAFAWQKRKVLEQIDHKPLYMNRLTLRQSCMMWLGWNLASELISRRHHKRFLLLRYEDFVDRPRDIIERIVDFVGEPSSLRSPPFIDSHTVQLSANHNLVGNPNRFIQGPVRIRSDEEWKNAVHPIKQLAALGLTWPLCLRYGYLSMGSS